MLAFISLAATTQAVPVLAQTVHYKGTAINWDHGRRLVVFSYSNVYSHVYSHSATANSTFSGWKKKGNTADAQQYVGNGRASAYWDARG